VVERRPKTDVLPQSQRHQQVLNNTTITSNTSMHER